MSSQPEHTDAAAARVGRLAWFWLLPLAAAAVWFVVASIHWPLIGDASQIHYICFLMDHGMAPYRVAGDMNMPGALLLEWLVMHTLGPGALAWRCFDLGLAAAATGSMAVIAGRGRRLAGVSAGLLFLLLHGADGMNDLGERDLSIAALLLVAYACLFVLLRRSSGGESASTNGSWAALLLGLSIGQAATIKPQVLLFAIVLFFVAWRRRKSRIRLSVRLAALVAGLAVPLLAALALLIHEHAASAFLHGLTTVVPYYAGLDHKPLGYLLQHSVAPLMPVVAGWLLATAWTRPLTTERLLLLLGAAFGLFSYLVQAKGFPYYRYPLLAFLLLLVFLDCTEILQTVLQAARRRGVWSSIRAMLAALALCYCTWLGVSAAFKASRFHWWDEQFVTSAMGDLHTLGARDGQVQCIDSISGCGTALLRSHLVQATGVLSDFFLFGPAHAQAVEDARHTFQAAVEDPSGMPRILIITGGLHLHPSDPGDWHKLQTWPWFEQWLAQHYTWVLTRYPTRPVLWWSRPGMAAAYRVYIRNDDAAAARQRLAPDARATAQPLRLPEP
jgi:hypothetical protein